MTAAPVISRLAPKIIELEDRLFQITLQPSLPGFDDFICAYLHAGSPGFLVDVGPASTANQLSAAMEQLGVNRLDFILLTHIHLDHAGAVGEAADRFPTAAVVCHPSAFSHLEDPTRLWQGTVKTLGDIGRAYGPIQPLQKNRLMNALELDAGGLRSVPTPGHAPHHVSYLFQKTLFAGEAGGVSLPLPSSPVYLRPATPPRFHLKTSLASIDALMEERASRICYGHLGAREDVHGMLANHRSQLLLWSRIVEEESRKADRNILPGLLMKRLLQDDFRLASFSDLPRDVRDRETFFLTNSISGFVQALDALADNP
ncbi:MAG: MBL fold metallo-hydrolase [Thermodesulfobacteriota bacterium]